MTTQLEIGTRATLFGNGLDYLGLPRKYSGEMDNEVVEVRILAGPRRREAMAQHLPNWLTLSDAHWYEVETLHGTHRGNVPSRWLTCRVGTAHHEVR